MEVGQKQWVWHLRCVLDPEDMLVTMGCRAVSGDNHDLLLVGHHAFEDNVVPLLSSSYSYVAVDLVEQAVGGAIVETVAVNTAGGQAASAAPQNCAALVRKLTNGVGRGKNGRMYVPGLLEGNIAPDGAIDGGVISSWNTALTAMLADCADATIDSQAVVNRSTGAGPHVEPIQQLVLDTFIATQRRRLRR
jgi:hypothetical protein